MHHQYHLRETCIPRHTNPITFRGRSQNTSFPEKLGILQPRLCIVCDDTFKRHIPCDCILAHLDPSSPRPGPWVCFGLGGPKLIFIYLSTPKRQSHWTPNPNGPNAPDEEGRRVTKMGAVARYHPNLNELNGCDVATESKDRHAMAASWHPGSTGPAHVRHTRTCTANPPRPSINGGH